MIWLAHFLTVADEYVSVELKENVMKDWARIHGGAAPEIDSPNDDHGFLFHDDDDNTEQQYQYMNPIQQVLAVTVAGDH